MAIVCKNWCIKHPSYIDKNIENNILEILEECKTLATSDQGDKLIEKIKNNVSEAIEQAKNHEGLMNLIVFVGGVEESRVIQKGKISSF